MIEFPSHFRYEDCYFCGTNFLCAGGPKGYCVCAGCQREHSEDLEGLFREMRRLAREEQV